jgi:hypothetical protein
LFRELTLGGKLVTRTEVAFFQETLDLFNDSLIKTAASDRLDDGQELTSTRPLVRWSDQT